MDFGNSASASNSTSTSNSNSNSSNSNSDGRPDWAVLQLISGKLENPKVPGVVPLSSICRAWHTAAQQTPGLSITWHSRQLLPGETTVLRQQQVEESFYPWLARWARQVDSFVMVPADVLGGGADIDVLYWVLTDIAVAAATAGQPLRLQRLQLPSIPQMALPTDLAMCLPFLRHLALPLDTWPKGRLPDQLAPFLWALGALTHLQVLEVGWCITSPWMEQQDLVGCWEVLLQAAPKQLQRLSVQVIHRVRNCQGVLVPSQVPYTWEPLAPFTQLQRLELGDIAAGHHLSPLAKQLPALTSLGIKHTCGGGLEQLMGVKGLLRDLHMDGLRTADEQHLKQLTRLTSLTMAWGGAEAQCPIPQAVAAGLHKLDWNLEKTGSHDSDSSSSGSSGRTAGQQLAQCSSKLRDLQLRGTAWTQDGVGAAAALRQLTGLTSFGLHCMRQPGAPPMDLGSWPSRAPLQHLKQLRNLALPLELLATEQPWLGGLVHLTRLQLAIEWSSKTAAGPWGPQEVFGGAQGKVQANLVSCRPGLKVLEADIYLLYPLLGRVENVEPVVPAVEGWLKQQLPGVSLVLTWGHNMDICPDRLAAAFRRAYGPR